MFYDELPIWGFIGKVERLPGGGGVKPKERLSLFTHIHFDVLYNGDRVIQVDISTGEGAGGGGALVRCEMGARSKCERASAAAGGRARVAGAAAKTQHRLPAHAHRPPARRPSAHRGHHQRPAGHRQLHVQRRMEGHGHTL